MAEARKPENEAERLEALRQCGVLDTARERSFDDLVELAARMCGTPMAMVSLVDSDRQWFKASVGVDAEQTPRDQAFCAHAILSNEPLIVRDAEKDARMSDSALVTGDPHVRFYAGVPLISREGLALGTLCVMDTEPREITRQQLDSLTRLAHQAQSQLNTRREQTSQSVLRTGTQAALETSTSSLAVERERLELVLAGSGLGSWEFNPQTWEALFDSRWLALLGLSHAPTRREEWSLLIHADDLQSVLTALDCHAAGETARFESAYRMKHADGGWRWLRSRGVVVARDAAGRPVRVVGTTEDITELRRAQAEQAAALVTATALARAANVPEAAQAVCDALEQGTGLSRNAVLLFDDNGVCDFVGWRGLSETYRNAVRGHCPWPLHARNAEPIVIANVMDAPGFSAYQDLFAKEKVGSLAFIPISTEAGVVGKLMLYGETPRGVHPAAVRAATAVALSLASTVDRLHMATTLAENERRYRAMVDGTDVVLWEFSPDSNCFTFVSPQAERLGHPLKEWFRPNFWQDHLHPEDREEAISYCLSETKAGRDHRFQYRMLRADGGVMWIEDYVRFEVDPCGKTMMRGVMVDITERKRDEAKLVDAQERASAASRAKSEFLANMSHEIRTPMTAILGFADLIAEDGAMANDPQQRREAISTIRRNGEHLLAIINDILDISKIEAGKMSANIVPTTPAAIVSDILSLMSVKAQAKGLTLRAAVDTPIPRTIACDPVRLRQILVNLVGNAIKFTEIGGVTIRLRYDRSTPESLHFDIADTGIGLDAGQSARLFSAFAQADASTSRRFGGTGLGLHISQRLAEMLGGGITVTSQPGKGSVFSLTVATGNLAGIHINEAAETLARIEHPIGAVAASRIDASTQPLKGVRILLAEDGPDNLRLIDFYLRRAGAHVTAVADGRLAIAALSAASPTPNSPLLNPPPVDLIITDMQMPEMDGYAAVRMLRSRGCRTPIIALTAHAMNGDQERCLAAGCDHYLTKPVDRSALIELCRAAVAGGHEAAKSAA